MGEVITGLTKKIFLVHQAKKGFRKRISKVSNRPYVNKVTLKTSHFKDKQIRNRTSLSSIELRYIYIYTVY